MRFLVMTDIEGVTGVTTFPQAEASELGRQMLMHDLNAVVAGIRAAGDHEIVLYDMHTDGRNIDLNALDAEITAVVGKPISGRKWKSLDGRFDGLFLVGLHAMGGTPDALMAHTYLREYQAVYLNDQLVGEIAIEAALAGEQGIPLLFVSGDSAGCAEARRQFPSVQTVVVKDAIGDAQALCQTPARTRQTLFAGAEKAASQLEMPKPFRPDLPARIAVEFSECHYLTAMRQQHPEIFVSANRVEMTGPTMLECWAQYLSYERAMVNA